MSKRDNADIIKAIVVGLAKLDRQEAKAEKIRARLATAQERVAELGFQLYQLTGGFE